MFLVCATSRFNLFVDYSYSSICDAKFSSMTLGLNLAYYLICNFFYELIILSIHRCLSYVSLKIVEILRNVTMQTLTPDVLCVVQ